MKKSNKKQDNPSTEETVMDKLESIGVTKDDLYPEGNPDVDEEQDPVRKGHLEIKKIPVIVFNDGDKKSRIMIKELEAKDHIDIVTVIQGTSKIVQVLKQEKEKGNLYNIAYLPYSNDDTNKDEGTLRKDIEKINAKVRVELELNTSVYAYFQDREDAEINKIKDPQE